VGTYRDDDEALEARAAELRVRLEAKVRQIAEAEAARDRTLRSAPQGPPIWLSCLIPVLLAVVAAMVGGALLLVALSQMRD
jgi:hypothetical protein